MKTKVKKYGKGMLTDSSGNPVRSGSGEVVRTRSDDEIAEDNKFGGYGKYMPKTKSYSVDDVKSGIGKLLGGKSSPSEDRPTSSGVEDYASMGKRSGAMPAKSTWDGSTDIRPEKPQDISERELEREPDSVAGEGAKNLAFEPDAETVVKKKTVIKKKPAVDNSLRLMKPKDPSRALEEARKHYTGYEDTGAKIGSQGDFKMKPSVPESTSGMGPKNTFLTKERMGVKDKSTGSFMDRVKEHLGNEFKSKKMASGGKVSTASSRGDGIAQRGKTKGRIC
jgi:hypothetical protein